MKKDLAGEFMHLLKAVFLGVLTLSSYVTHAAQLDVLSGPTLQHPVTIKLSNYLDQDPVSTNLYAIERAILSIYPQTMRLHLQLQAEELATGGHADNELCDQMFARFKRGLFAALNRDASDAPALRDDNLLPVSPVWEQTLVQSDDPGVGIDCSGRYF